MCDDKYGSPLKPPISTFELNTDGLSLNEQIKLMDLSESNDFGHAKTMRQQVILVSKVLFDDNSRINYSTIAKIFKSNVNSIKRHINSPVNLYKNGRPSIFPEGTKEFIIQIVYEQFQKKNPINYDFLQEAIWKQYNITVLSDTLRHFCRNIKEIKSVDGVPMEKNRIEVNIDDLKQKYNELDNHLKNIPGEFVFNVDESGCSEWIDAQAIKVLVPSDFANSSIKIPKDRNSKRVSLVGCIAADGEALKPMLIIPRKTIESELALYGYNSNVVSYAYQEHSFMTSKIFEQWANEIFFPYVIEKRKRLHYNGDALIILDGLGAHDSVGFKEGCERYNIKILTLVPHSSDQTQPLDLVTFSLFKRYYSRSTFNYLISNQSNQLIKMLGAWYQATPPHQVIIAFMAAGMRPTLINNMHYYTIDLSLATKLRDWRVSEDGLINDNSASKRIRITKNNDK